MLSFKRNPFLRNQVLSLKTFKKLLLLYTGFVKNFWKIYTNWLIDLVDPQLRFIFKPIINLFCFYTLTSRVMIYYNFL